MKLSAFLLWGVWALLVGALLLTGLALAQGIEVHCQEGYCLIKETDLRAIVEHIIRLEKKGVCI